MKTHDSHSLPCPMCVGLWLVLVTIPLLMLASATGLVPSALSRLLYPAAFWSLALLAALKSVATVVGSRRRRGRRSDILPSYAAVDLRDDEE